MTSALSEAAVTLLTVLAVAGGLAIVGIALGWAGVAGKNRALTVTGAVALFAGGLLVLGWAIVDGTGVRAATVGLIAALLPAPILVGTFLWLGRYRRRPWLVLAFCFGWGACVATAIALGVNTGIAVLLDRNGFDQGLAAVVSAPVIEEIAKLLGPLLVYWTARRHLTGTLDAIVYCGLAGAGFAVSENVLYASGTYVLGASLDDAAGIAQVTILVVVRGLATMFAHPLMTGLSAIGLGRAARLPGRKGRQAVWIIGMLLCGMGLHALWNGSSLLGVALDMPALWFALYPAFLAPLFFTMVGAALWLRAADARRTQTALAPLVAAAQISPPELASLATFSRRSAARDWALRWAGKPGEAAMKDFQRAASDVAEQYDLASIGAPWSEREVHEGVQRMNTARTGYVGRDPRTPPALWDGHRYHVAFPDGQMRAIEPPAQPVMPLPLAPPPPPPAYPVTYA
ncbi:Membrane proteinase PrsW, cleaves anti-sigma factor RsiW, M82 family [Glycomyces sambucus]|uniref:Membrane proteinase PrsW, cleaves anti-sigma factor RsiW, M82 family n=1 Tax=Glycomyces sambucus TaxID=380244 RepID=A0A1G9H9D8_9ACTN|nr:PrsW family intramembrane metalloprotease [Glycomyces sambucus]SDL09053.1 Membrane proteinase PrsW, cleaves anti-sigma factor RsiW, M82 family [Glycomyces sambucus]